MPVGGSFSNWEKTRNSTVWGGWFVGHALPHKGKGSLDLKGYNSQVAHSEGPHLWREGVSKGKRHFMNNRTGEKFKTI